MRRRASLRARAAEQQRPLLEQLDADQTRVNEVVIDLILERRRRREAMRERRRQAICSVGAAGLS